MWKEADLDEHLRVETAASGKKQLAAVLTMFLPRRLCDALLPQAGLPADRKAAALSRPDRARLVACLKRLSLPVRAHSVLVRRRSRPAASPLRKSIHAPCKANSFRTCISPANCSIWTDQSAATTFRRRGVRVGWQEERQLKSGSRQQNSR